MKMGSIVVVILILFAFIFALLHFHASEETILIPNSFSDLSWSKKVTDDLLEYMIKSRHWAVRPTKKGISCRLRKEFYEELFGDRNLCVSSIISYVSHEDGNDLTKQFDWTVEKPLKYVKVPVKLFFEEGLTECSSKVNFEFTPFVMLTIFESGNSRKRIGTEKMMSYFDKIFSAIQNKKVNELLRKEKSILEISKSQDFMCIENSETGCMSGKVTGWVNPGESGYIDVSYYDIPSLQEVSENKRFRTAEYVGWDKTKTNKYYFSNDLEVDGDGELHNMKVEICFHSSNSEDRILISTNAVIRTWKR